MKISNRRISIEDQRAIEKALRDFKSQLDSHEALKLAAKHKADEAVAEAVLMGRSLMVINNVLSKEEMRKYLTSHGVKVKPEVLAELMRLAESNWNSFLRDALLRRAYKTFGILDDAA